MRAATRSHSLGPFSVLCLGFVVAACARKESTWPDALARQISHAILWSPPAPEPNVVRPPGYEPPPPNPFAEQLYSERREGERLAVEMMALAIKYDSDLPRQLRNAAREIGADPATAASNIDVIRHLAKQQRERLQDLSNSNPTLRRQIEDPEFAEMVDDASAARIKALPPLERIARHWTRLLHQ